MLRPIHKIVGAVEAANQIDINYAKLAMSKAKDKQVKDFAQQMITDPCRNRCATSLQNSTFFR